MTEQGEGWAGAVRVRMDVTQDVVNEGGFRRSDLESMLSLKGEGHKFSRNSLQVCTGIPTSLPSILLNGVVQSIKPCVGDHGVTSEHDGHDVRRREKREFCSSTKSAHGE